jgi:hypothetical protein
MIQQSARYPMDSISLALSSNSMVARIVKRSLALIALTLATACKHDGKSEDLKSPAVDRFGDPAYEVVNVGTYNYTRNDIYDVYILQPGSDDIDRASRAVGGLAPDKDAVNWQGIGIMATLAWDWRWRTPKRFDLIWLNVFDRKAYESAASYNAYKSRNGAGKRMVPPRQHLCAFAVSKRLLEPGAAKSGGRFAIEAGQRLYRGLSGGVDQRRKRAFRISDGASRRQRCPTGCRRHGAA